MRGKGEKSPEMETAWFRQDSVACRERAGSPQAAAEGAVGAAPRTPGQACSVLTQQHSAPQSSEGQVWLDLQT